MRVLKKDIEPLLHLLSQTEIPINYHRARKKDKNNGSMTPAGKGRTVLLGYIPFKKDTLSNFTKKHPERYKELKSLAVKYAPFPVDNFMLNKNYETQPHYDGMNVGESIIFSFGDYTGGELVVEGKIVDTYMKTHTMNGSQELHWNNPITSGTKYSVIFFNTRKKNTFITPPSTLMKKSTMRSYQN